MVVILAEGIILILAWVEQQLPSEHFKYHANCRPHICRYIILAPDQYLRTPILSRLDFCREMMVLPAGVAEVGDLHFKTWFKLDALVEHQLLLKV